MKLLSHEFLRPKERSTYLELEVFSSSLLRVKG